MLKLAPVLVCAALHWAAGALAARARERPRRPPEESGGLLIPAPCSDMTFVDVCRSLRKSFFKNGILRDETVSLGSLWRALVLGDAICLLVHLFSDSEAIGEVGQPRTCS